MSWCFGAKKPLRNDRINVTNKIMYCSSTPTVCNGIVPYSTSLRDRTNVTLSLFEPKFLASRKDDGSSHFLGFWRRSTKNSFERTRPPKIVKWSLTMSLAGMLSASRARVPYSRSHGHSATSSSLEWQSFWKRAVLIITQNGVSFRLGRVYGPCHWLAFEYVI